MDPVVGGLFGRRLLRPEFGPPLSACFGDPLPTGTTHLALLRSGLFDSVDRRSPLPLTGSHSPAGALTTRFTTHLLPRPTWLELRPVFVADGLGLIAKCHRGC